MSAAAGWIVDALLASALLMGAVLLVRGPVRRAFGPQVAYALWALPGLRLLLPPLPTGWPAPTNAPITRAGETIVMVIEPAREAAGLSVGTVAFALWLAGVLAFLVWHLARHGRFTRRVLHDARVIEERDGVTVVVSAAAPGPVAFGIHRRFVAFPIDFTVRYDADERALALAHELGHHARADLLANWAALVVLALHWFDPIAWRAFRAFRADQELANDARVLAGCSVADRHAYGRALVKTTAPDRAIASTCHLHTIADLKGRLRMLTMSTTSRRRFAAGIAAVTLLTAGGLGLTASGSAAAVRVSESVDAALQTPTPPIPPAPIAGDPRQARTIVVRPDGRGATTLIVRRAAVAPGAPLPPDVRLPKDFELPRGCMAGRGEPAQVIKGQDGDQTYTILCAASPAGGDAGTDERSAYQQALASLRTVRGQIATQVTPAFPESDRRDALAAVDRSIVEIEADLAALR